EVVVLPAGCEKADDAQAVTVGTRHFYDHIVKKIPGGPDVSFRLIRHEKATDPTTFYMMENKVSNELFEKAAADPEFQRLLDGFKRDNPWTVKRIWNHGGVVNMKELGVPDIRLPVLRVTVT